MAVGQFGRCGTHAQERAAEDHNAEREHVTIPFHQTEELTAHQATFKRELAM